MEKRPDDEQVPSAKMGRPPRSNYAATGVYVKSPDGLKLRSRKVHRLVQKLKGVLPWLEPSDLPAARSWAELELIGASVFAELVKNGVIGPQGEGRRLLDEYRRLKLAQLQFEKELGMTPAARMAIKANGTRAAFDLAAAMAKVNEADGGEVDHAK